MRKGEATEDQRGRLLTGTALSLSTAMIPLSLLPIIVFLNDCGFWEIVSSK